MRKTLTRISVDQPSDLAISCVDQFGLYDKVALICSDALIGSDFPIVAHHIPIIPFYCYAHSIAFAYVEFGLAYYWEVWVSIMMYNGVNDLSLFIHKNVFIHLFDK